jgi:hypothetical protein
MTCLWVTEPFITKAPESVRRKSKHLVEKPRVYPRIQSH